MNQELEQEQQKEEEEQKEEQITEEGEIAIPSQWSEEQDLLEIIQNDPDSQQVLLRMGFVKLYNSMNQIRGQLQGFVEHFKGETNKQITRQLEQNLQQMGSKLEELKQAAVCSDREGVIQIIDEVKELILSSSGPLEALKSGIIDEFHGLQLDFAEPRKVREIKSALERKQERKRARMQRSKQALNQMRRVIIMSLIGVQRFVKNPENIAKCFMIGVTCFFVSSYMQIPDMSNRHSLYLLDWLAYNRSSRSVLVSGSLCLISMEWYILYLIWVSCVGFNIEGGQSENKKLKTMLNECNPLLQLSLVFMTDTDLINNKFDLCVWLCNYFLYGALRVYHLHAMMIIKRILSNLTAQNLQKIFVLGQLSMFSVIVVIINGIYTINGIIMFNKVGVYAISLLFFGGITTTIEYVKLLLICKQLQQKYGYYINNNIDQLNEPYYYQELVCDSLYHLFKVIYSLQLTANYFRTVSLQFVLHLWLFYLLSDLQSYTNNKHPLFIDSVSQLKKIYDQYVRFKKIQSNLDTLFPQVHIEDEICSICHDELLVARTLPCQHMFHLKCLYNWFKNQQMCPICRSPVTNLDINNNNQPMSFLGRILNVLTNITLFNITIYFQSNRNQQPEEQEQPLI